MPSDLEVLRAWASRPEVQALSEEARLEAAGRELGLRPIRCPNCRGVGCRICNGHGRVFRLGDRGQA